MKKVLIATPCLDGKVNAEYCISLNNTILLGLHHNIQFLPLLMCNDALLERARNDLFYHAYISKVDEMLFIDSDQEWEAKWAIDVINTDYDVVGLPIIRKNDCEAYNVKCNPQKLFDTIDQKITEVDSIGTGFLKLSQKAIKSLWDSSSFYIENSIEKRWICEVKIEENQIIGEDVVLCNKLRKLGFKINLLKKHTVAHIGNKKYIGNFDNFIDRLNRDMNT